MVTKKKTAKKTVKKEAVEEVKTPEEEKATEEENAKVEPEVKEEKKETSIGSLKGGKKVYQAVKTVKLQSLRGPIEKSKLPEDIQRWLTNKGYGTNIYIKDKEWMEKHHVDMKMVEKLKKFINDNYL